MKTGGQQDGEMLKKRQGERKTETMKRNRTDEVLMSAHEMFPLIYQSKIQLCGIM